MQWLFLGWLFITSFGPRLYLNHVLQLKYFRHVCVKKVGNAVDAVFGRIRQPRALRFDCIVK